jgi:AcrR family transcriptional regulator
VTDKPTPEARRQAILEAAIGVFAQHGFDAATTDDIARAAGLSKGGLYWHFKSKDEILAAVLMQFFDQEMAALAGLVAAGGSASVRVRKLVSQAAADMAQLEQVLPIALEFYALAARQEHVRQWIQGYYGRYHSLLVALLRQGYASGEFRAGTAETAALTLIAQMEGLALVRSIEPRVVRLPDQAEAAAELLLSGLMAADT